MTTVTDANTTVFERRESVVRSYCRGWPVVFQRARGAELTSEDGTTYLDFFAGAGALNYGHNHPAIKGPLMDYLAEDNVIHSLDMFSVAKREFLEAFEQRILSPRGMDYRVMLPGPTGTNTVEAALKLVRKVTGRRNVVAFTGGFHGMTVGALSVTSNPKKRAGAGVPLHYTVTAPYDGYLSGDAQGSDFEWLERQWNSVGPDELPAGVIVEPVQGEGGLNAARMEWLKGLEELCRRYDVKLIIDDVQAGCGRTGTFFSFEPSGITPDVICLSKSISGLGSPLALTLIRPEMDVWNPGEHNGTFRGFNPSFVTAKAALDHFWADEEFQTSVQARGEQLKAGLEKIAATVPGGHYRGRGLLAGLGFDDPELAGKIAGAAFERHLLLETAGPKDEVLKAMPPLVVTEEEVERALAIIAECVADLVPQSA